MDVASGLYTGNGATPRSIVGAGFTPKVVVVLEKGTTGEATRTVWKTADMSSTNSFLWMDSDASTAERIRSLDSDGFTIGSDAFVNTNTDEYVWWALSEDANNLQTGTYDGTGTDDRNIPTNFQPDIVIVQATPQTGDNTKHCYLWVATQGGDSAANIEANLAAASNQIQGVAATSFQVGTVLNTVGQTYFWLALKRAADNITEGTYTGNFVDDRSIVFSGDAFTPEVVLVKGAISGAFNLYSVRTSGGHSGDSASQGQQLEGANVIQGFTSSGFQIGSDTTINNTLGTYWFIAFASGAVVVATRTPSTAALGGGFYQMPFSPYTFYKSSLALLTRYRNVKLR